MLFELLERHLRQGELTIVEPSGLTHRFGNGTPRATWVFDTPDAPTRILRNPAWELGQTYLEEGWHVADGTLADLLRILRLNLEREVMPATHLARVVRLIQSWNNRYLSRMNVARHYDLDEALFRTFLDRDMHYSCGYFRHPDDTLESAQIAKCEHIAAKLALVPGQRVLDIGSGWGSLAFHLASRHEVSVTGLTLSKEQLRVAREEAARRGLADRVSFRLEDYREHRGRYDRIVSVGMFEHVGRRFHRAFFRQLERLMAPSGSALLHTIGRTKPPGPTNPWIRRYIFPGGYIPSISEVAAAVERSGLMATDLEVLRDHYALTLAEWNRRFQAARDQFVAARGEGFCRMWEFYLVTSQTAFECRDLVVQQWQLARPDTRLPVTRNYLDDSPPRPTDAQ